MLFVLITCISFIFFYKSLPLKPLPKWAYEIRSLSLLFWKELSFFFYVSELVKNSSLSGSFIQIPPKMSTKKKTLVSKVQSKGEICVLDLPELVLDCILERLPPDELCSMAGVCSALRDSCTSDRLWERHMKQKWGRIMGPAAYRKWQWHIASRRGSGFLHQSSQPRGLIWSLSRLWPLSLIRSNYDNISNRKSFLPVDSFMSWYLALETGQFWFPAQVYNRENGHVGFMLSCYDAELCYDRVTDTFQARYPPHGRRPSAVESGVTWDRLRAPPLDTCPHDLHITDCLDELWPGNHIEIQWRRNKEFPYGWWYGVVGHLESCNGSDNYCRCSESDTVVLEFNQYTPGSRWRRTSINRKDHCEEGNEADGFMGELENFAAMMIFPCGGDFGQLKSWNRRRIEKEVGSDIVFNVILVTLR